MTPSADDIYIQRCRVAAKYFFRYRSSLKISFSDNPYYDLFIEDKSNGLSFGVKVVSENYEESDEFKQDYLSLLKSINRQNYSPFVPIALLSIEEETELGKCGTILSIRWTGVTVNYPPKMKDLNSENFVSIMNDINTSDYIIRSLYDDSLGVLKTISFKLPNNSTNIQGGNIFGKIVYKRSFTQYYKMNSPEIIDDKERFQRLLHGTPQQEYPEDRLDKLIYDAVSEHFMDVRINNSLFLFNTELRDLKLEYACMLRKHLTIQIEPNLDAETLTKLGNFINCPRINLTLFIQNPY